MTHPASKGTVPLLSIIVPVYNAAATLRRCVGSIVAQTETRWELLLIDDGSTDGSAALCDAYAAQDSRIRALHKANGGVSSARNLGLREARGEWLAYLMENNLFGWCWCKMFRRSVVERGRVRSIRCLQGAIVR